MQFVCGTISFNKNVARQWLISALLIRVDKASSI